VKRIGLLLAACALFALSAIAQTNGIVSRRIVKNYLVPAGTAPLTGNESRAGSKWGHTNIWSTETVVLVGPGLPLFTNRVPFKTNVTWKHWPVTPLHSPKTKPETKTKI